jgi:hypothetical protein
MVGRSEATTGKTYFTVPRRGGGKEGNAGGGAAAGVPVNRGLINGRLSLKNRISRKEQDNL